jgi:hypothetical protein
VSPRALIALLAMAPAAGFAQTGRDFTAVESYVALGESFRVGKITKLEPIEYDKPLVGEQVYGKPYRLTFGVEETIRGTPAKQIELVLSLQDTRFLEYMREHSSAVMMVGGQHRINTDPSPEIGVEEDGRRVDGHWYQFLFLDAPTKADRQKDPDLVKQISITYNEGRMFTIDLHVVQGREAILKRARAFAGKHKEKDESVWLGVPNAFGELVGYSNAYCGITLPVCPETERTLVSLLKNPRLILDRVAPHGDWEKNLIVIEALKCLKPFPNKPNAVLVRRFLGDYEPASASKEVRYGTTQYIQQTAWEILDA